MVTVLTGENSYSLQADLRRRIADFVTEHTDIGLERLDGEEASYDRIREALGSLPFLSSKKLVVLYKPSVNNELTDKLAELLEQIPEATDLVIIEPKPDKRTVFFKVLKKVSEYKEFNELDEARLAHWLVDYAKESGGSLDPADARYLVQRVGANQRLLANELDKLLNYNLVVSRGTIDLLTEMTPQSTIFELLDAVLSGNVKRALGIYQEQRALKVQPQKILAMVAWQLHILAIIKSAPGGKDIGMIANQAKIKPFVAQKSQNLSKYISFSQIKRMISSALKLDIRMKSEAIDADEALQNLLMEISAKS